MVNDIKSSENLNFLVKFTDDLTSSILVKSGDSKSNSAANEVYLLLHNQLLLACNWTLSKGGGLISLKFTYAVESWDRAYNHKYLSSVGKLFKRAFKLDYCYELFFAETIVALNWYEIMGQSQWQYFN